jgi:hypothetical protein
MRTILLILSFVLSSKLQAQFNCQSTKNLTSPQSSAPINYNSRSDTADLQKLKLTIDSRDFGNGQLSGVAKYKLYSKLAFNNLRFDLLGFTVDSVISSNGSLNFTQDGEHVIINESVSAGQTMYWDLYYHGATTKDASGWGGVHLDGAYQYNLGVGFAANPHVYGRSVFPCFDNFVEKSILEEMNIITSPNKVGVSNGILSEIDTLGNGDLMWKWEGQKPIPSYLVSIAVSDYFKQSWTHDGKSFEIYGRAQDTSNMTAGFVHLTEIYDAFIKEFGPYPFEKVGYALTITGAMEHAGMVHLPRNLANANLAGEDIIAHELAHMWFGNGITTRTAEDMWINEGFAEFGSHLYEESVYGRYKYIKTVQNNQSLVLKQAYANDGGHLALSGVNQDQTYGTHTYQKGAMVVHNLREFLGDSLFSSGIKQLLASNLYGNINAEGFKTSLSAVTGRNLDDFWNDWIYNTGYHGAWMELNYPVNANWSATTKSINLHHLSAHTGTYKGSGKSVPVSIYKHSFNHGYQGKLSLGTSSNFQANNLDSTYYTNSIDLGAGQDYWLSTNDSAESLGTSVYDTFTWSSLTGTRTLAKTGVKITPKSTNSGLDGTFYVWHHRTAGLYEPNGTTSRDHFYFIGYEGNHSPPISYESELPFEVTIPFNTNPNNGGLDSDLNGLPASNMTIGESPTIKWKNGVPIGNASTQALGNTGVGNISFTPKHVSRYYWIMNTSNIGNIESSTNEYTIFPNPASQELQVRTNLTGDFLSYEITDTRGRHVAEGKSTIVNKINIVLLPEQLDKGNYLFHCELGVKRFSIL